jgi:hypothetical protein
MTPTERAIAMNRKRAEQTLALIEEMLTDPASPARDRHIQILQELLGHYIMTADLLETGMRVTSSSGD